jgi:immune inhibitor A
MTRNAWIALIAIVLLACCCVSVAVLGAGGFMLIRTTSTQVGPVLTSFIPILTDSAATEAPTPVPNIVRTPVPSPVAGGLDTLTTLEQEVVPPNDWRELALRLKGVKDIPEVVSTTPADYASGAEVEFWVSNTDTDKNTEVTARLAYQTTNVYFFVQDGVDANLSDIKKLVDQFQNKTYPTDREFFGSEWTPGVDGDSHLYILFTGGMGAGTAGYFDSSSEYSRLANPYSNEKEMFFLNADIGLAYPWSGVLAHEFQHMIHWYHDRNEESWMNEGSSMLAEEINSYPVESFDLDFLSDPDLQLNTWSDPNAVDNQAHYGSAYLFMKYFLDRFGEEATKALVADPANGLQAVDHTLSALGETDPVTGKALTADNLFADWTIANFLNDSTLDDGRYAFKNYSRRVDKPTETVTNCPTGPTASTVRQYGTDYIDLRCDGDITVSFTGSQQVQLVPTHPHGGRYAFWSNRADESDTTLTRDFDLSGTTKATLDYWAWWQIEKNWDYAYLDVSTDGGQTWTIIHTPSSTNDNPQGSNMGWGYTGCSGDNGDPGLGCQAEWIRESVDLSAYVGKKITVRFEYVTDANLSYTSLMIDDISVPELNYSCDFEKDACGWQPEGFARIDNVLPQTFSVQVINISGDQTTVTRVPLDANNQGSLPLNLKRGDRAILVVSGITPFTTEPASYEHEVK